MENLLSDVQLAPVISTIVYSVIGIVIFIFAYMLMEFLTPYSIRKEIEEDQNVALGIMIGSSLIALSIIISAAIR